MKYFNLYFKKKYILKIINVSEKFIDNIGVKNIYYPFIFDNFKGSLQRSIGLWNISVSLDSYKRGIHMSRIIKILDKILIKPINFKNFFKIYNFFIYKLFNNNIVIQLSFIYFLRKISPISLNKSLSNYKLTLFLKKSNIFLIYFLKIVVSTNMLCPCSKYVSQYNSHNQRCYISLFLFFKKKVNLNSLIKILESSSSVSLWSIIKRNDERYVTEFSYKNSKFIEDLTRNIYFKLKKRRFFLKIENLESIHSYNAFSFIKNKL